MKALTLLALVLFAGRSFAEETNSKLYLICKITSDGVNPNIPRSFKAYVNFEEKNWRLAYAVAGVTEDKFTLKASGDVWNNKRTRALESAHFDFEDGTILDINFSSGVGISSSDNIIFKHLEKAELADCKILD